MWICAAPPSPASTNVEGGVGGGGALILIFLSIDIDTLT